MSKSKDSQPTRGWDTYWRGARDAEAYSSGGVSHPIITSYWDHALHEFLAARDNTRILDVATGSGAVVERLSQIRGASLENVTCVDISAAAIDGVRSRFPDVVGVVADANSVPLESSQYDLVISQFGIEYAGLAAIDEATRLLAPDGTLMLLMHIRPGIIFDECTSACDAILRTIKSGFIQRSLQLFESGFAAVRGAERTAYDQAALQLNPAIQELESILSEYGEHVAGDTIVRLYSDVKRIHSRIQYYEPNDVLGWLRTMDGELSGYKERMASMCDAATDDKTFNELCENLREQGFNIVKGKPLFAAEEKLPIAWILRASRSI